MGTTKQFIIESSLKLFLQRSFKEVTMKDIVKNTGLSTGAFYHYFKNKKEIYREVVDYYLSTLMVIDYSKVPQESLGQFYKGILTQLHHFARDESNYEDGAAINQYELFFSASREFPQITDKLIEAHTKELDVWMRVIGNSRASGEVRTSTPDDTLARLFIVIADGIGINLITENRLQDMQNELRVAWDAIYRLIRINEASSVNER